MERMTSRGGAIDEYKMNTDCGCRYGNGMATVDERTMNTDCCFTLPLLSHQIPPAGNGVSAVDERTVNTVDGRAENTDCCSGLPLWNITGLWPATLISNATGVQGEQSQRIYRRRWVPVRKCTESRCRTQCQRISSEDIDKGDDVGEGGERPLAVDTLATPGRQRCGRGRKAHTAAGAAGNEPARLVNSAMRTSTRKNPLQC